MVAVREITHQQEKFALGVASGKTQADAYREAYPRSKAWKDDSVHNKASLLMRNAQVAARVAELKERITNAGIASAERVLLEASRLALFDPRKLFNEGGVPKPINELDDDTASAIAGLEVVEEFTGSGQDRVFIGFTKKYKVADKNSALEKLFKHHGLYKEDNKQKADPLVELLRGLGSSALPVVKGGGSGR